MYFVVTMVAVITISNGALALANGANFDGLPLAAESYWNGSDSSGGFNSGSAFFNNNYDTTYDSWDGFAYSNLSQEETPATLMPGQYTAITNAGQSPANYGIAYVGWAGPPTMMLGQPLPLDGAYFTNNYSAYYSMLNGDWAAKKFGGVSGDDQDWFLLTIKGFDSQNNSTGTVEFYLADYRFADNNLDYIVDGWSWVDLSSLGEVKEVTFNLSSSDVGDWGMNTPAYFALDTVIMSPEPTTCLLLGIAALALLCRRK